MAGMRERFGGRLCPPSRLDGRRVRRLTGVDEGDIDDPVLAPKRGRYQTDRVNKRLIWASLPPDRRWYKGLSRTWIKVKNPKAPAATRAIDGTFSLPRRQIFLGGEEQPRNLKLFRMGASQPPFRPEPLAGTHLQGCRSPTGSPFIFGVCGHGEDCIAHPKVSQSAIRSPSYARNNF